jgi:hypothetical protein
MTNADEAPIQPSQMKAAWTVDHDGKCFVIIKHYEGSDGYPPFQVIETGPPDDPEGRVYSLDDALAWIGK